MTEEVQYDISDREEWQELDLPTKMEVLKATVTVPEVAQLAGLEVDEGDKIVSPWNPGENTPSCHLYDDHAFCYSTGRWGDIFDLVEALNPDLAELTPGQRLGKIVHMIWQRAVSVGKEYGDVEASQPRVLQDFTADLFERTHPVTEFIGLYLPGEYWVRRNEAGDILVPHRCGDGTDDHVYGVKVRWASGGKGSWAGSQFTHRLYNPYGYTINATQKAAVVCEGESDAWALEWSAGLHADVFAMPAGAKNWRDHWLEDLEPYDRVLVCMDNDRTGAEASDKLCRKIGWGRAEKLRVPQLFNDCREAIAAGWRPEVK
jgi:hypothetical protein